MSTASMTAVFNMQNQTYIYSSYELICILYTKNQIHFEIRCIANIENFTYLCWKYMKLNDQT